MGQPVLGTSVEGERITQVIAHGLASASDGHMEFALGVGGQLAHDFGDEISGQGVMGLGADVFQRLALVIAQDVDVGLREGDGGQVVIGAQAMKPAIGVQQVQLRVTRPRGGGDEVDLVRYPGVFRPASQRIKGFGDHLGGEAGHGEKDAAGIGVIHHGCPVLVALGKGSRRWAER